MGDGWGVAFYQGDDVALFREPRAAADSALVRYLESEGPSTNLPISHIRHATPGGGAVREHAALHARTRRPHVYVFAHNGDLPGIEGSAVLATGPYRLLGQTDSEHAFCALLSRMPTLWEEAGLPSLQARMSLLAAFAADLCTLGPANFLYADGDIDSAASLPIGVAAASANHEHILLTGIMHLLAGCFVYLYMEVPSRRLVDTHLSEAL